MADVINDSDPMLEPEDVAFVRSTAIGVLVGVVLMFAFVAIASAMVAGGAGWQFWIGVATFASIVTGGFFGGVVFAARHLMAQEKAVAHAPRAEVVAPLTIARAA
jgi:hypothetical protein